MKTNSFRQLSARVSIAVIWAGAQVTAAPFPTADPGDLGISGTALQAIADTIKGYCDRDIIVGGALLVIKNRHCVWSEAQGWQDRENRAPMLPDALFNIRSMTKMLPGAACQILIDEGRVHFDDAVAQYLPGFDTARSRVITVEQLLTHRSGLPLTVLTSADQYPTLYEMANAIGQRGPQFTPGSRFWYSDAGTDTLGAVVEVASGTTLDAFVRTRLLEPLGMQDTWYLHEAAAPRSRIASLYLGKVGAWTRIWTADQPFYPFAWGSQSLYSTPADYARFLAMLLDKGTANGRPILSETAVARILTPVSVMSSVGTTAPYPTGFLHTQSQYGQMCVLYESEGQVQAFGHNGSDGTWAWAWPKRDLMILYFTQSRGQATGTRLETEFDRWLLHPAVQPSAEIAGRYAPYLGWYRADFQSVLGNYRDEPFAVVIHDDRLGLDVPGQMICQLKDASPGGRWYFEAEGQLSISFDREPDGSVTGIRLQEPGRECRLPRMEREPGEGPRFGLAYRLPLGPDDAEISGFGVCLEGVPGYRYLIECSRDLQEWVPRQTNVLGGSRLEIRDADVGGAPQRFYRSRVVAF